MSKLEQVEKDIRILVVDDHQVTRGMIRTILRGVGFLNVLTADSGAVAHDIIVKENVDFVICDWNMPNGSGLDLLRELRANERFKELPFLMLTAEAYRENVTEALKAGVSGYIAKPFTADVLVDKLANVWLKSRKRGARPAFADADDSDTED